MPAHIPNRLNNKLLVTQMLELHYTAQVSAKKANVMARHNVIYIEAWYARDIPLGLACTRHGFDNSISVANQV